MKKFDKRWILFLVLIVALASGLSYLSLYQETETETENPNQTQTLSVALVNEDQGSTFNDTDLSFGDAFAGSIDRNNNHEWFVVSRGVAESGLENNTYDMMVVIPNDFSEKSLNIYSESPESVALQYKINASENPRVKEEAEKTASNILNDFNRRIIDVYFASIIGNLQNAQDNVGEMVNRQALHTNNYNNNVYQPLSGYTGQFDTIKNQAEQSTNNFSSFEDLLASYEDQLIDEAEAGEGYLSNIEDVAELKDSNLAQLLAFNEMFNQFNQNMRAGEVDQQLTDLMDANNYINAQLTLNEGEDGTNQPVSLAQNPNIKSNSLLLRAQIDQSMQRVQSYGEEVNNLVTGQGFEEQVRGKILEVLNNSDNPDGLNPNIQAWFANQDQRLNSLIQDEIDKLPSTESISELEGLKLVQMNKIREVDNVVRSTEGNNFGNDSFNKLIKKLNNGVEVSNTETIKVADEDSEHTFTLSECPEYFNVVDVSVLNNGSLVNENQQIGCSDTSNTVTLKGLTDGELEVKLHLELAGGAFNYNEPLEWAWTLTSYSEKEEEEIHEQEKEEEGKEPEEGETDPVEEEGPGEGETGPVEGVEPGEGDTTPGDEGEPGEGSTTPGDEGEPGEGSTTPGDEREPGEGDATPGEDEEYVEGDTTPVRNEGTGEVTVTSDEKEGPISHVIERLIEREITINNSEVNVSVESTISNYDDTTEELIRNLQSSINSYHKLHSLYELYYGDAIEQFDGGNSESDINHDTRSLYYLFNEAEPNELIASFIKDMAVAELRASVGDFQDDVVSYNGQLSEIYDNSEQLIAQIDMTAEEAARLNADLTQTIEDVLTWREDAMALLEGQQEIQASAEGEQTAVMTLGSDFQPILSSSQNLANQAENNLNTADQVYQTFEDIDNQATEIEQSGTNLVSDAETLAVELTNRLEDDEAFIENFTGVLANSRVGDRQNENLYDFLSSPVETSSQGTITTQNNTFTPYFLVLISFIVVLFTAYVISTINKKRAKDQFATEASLMSSNAPITIITAGIGLLEGIVIGIVSSYYLPISDLNMLQLTVIMSLLVTGMLLVATYLLRQMKMLGMFILLSIFSLYLFFTNALGSSTAAFPVLEAFSPLQYMETFLLRIVEGTANYGGAIFTVLILLLLGALGNLLVINRPERKEEMTDENQAEAG